MRLDLRPILPFGRRHDPDGWMRFHPPDGLLDRPHKLGSGEWAADFWWLILFLWRVCSIAAPAGTQHVFACDPQVVDLRLLRSVSVVDN